jgi:hypothetical protein
MPDIIAIIADIDAIITFHSFHAITPLHAIFFSFRMILNITLAITSYFFIDYIFAFFHYAIAITPDNSCMPSRAAFFFFAALICIRLLLADFAAAAEQASQFLR